MRDDGASMEVTLAVVMIKQGRVSQQDSSFQGVKGNKETKDDFLLFCLSFWVEHGDI